MIISGNSEQKDVKKSNKVKQKLNNTITNVILTNTNNIDENILVQNLNNADDSNNDENWNLLRPKKLSQVIGQNKVARQLNLIIESATIRQTLPEHILFYGQPGLGKTTMASLISNELKANLKVIAAPSLQKIGDLVSLLISLEEKTVLFIDEIHRLKAPLEESLYSAMEDAKVDLVLGKGHGASTARLDINPFTLVGATTQLGKVSKPLKDRFPSIFHLEPYSDTEMLDLVERSHKILHLHLTEDAKFLIARRSRGTPRIANNILKRMRDFQTVKKLSQIDKHQVEDFLQQLGIFDFGLTHKDLTYLKSLQNGPLGLQTLAGVLLEESETLEIVTEPYLIYLGFIDKSNEGRRLTTKGFDFIAKY